MLIVATDFATDLRDSFGRFSVSSIAKYLFARYLELAFGTAFGPYSLFVCNRSSLAFDRLGGFWLFRSRSRLVLGLRRSISILS